MSDPTSSRLSRWWRTLTATTPEPAPTPVPTEPPASVSMPAPAVPAAMPAPRKLSAAQDLPGYRADCAAHIYSTYPERIYPGLLPPMLHAIAVLEVRLDALGNVERLHWMRQPGHAPEVTAQIAALVRAAAPFPAAPQLAPASYTETWLWDASGRFQLHTLSEGQR